MTTKQIKLRELLGQLDSLQKRDLPNEDFDKVIENEITSFGEKLKADPTVKALRNFQNEIASLKKDMDLTPIMESLKNFQDEVSESQQNLTDEFTQRLEEIKNSIPVLPEPKADFDDSQLKQDIFNLREEFNKKIQAVPLAGLEKKLNGFKTQFQEFQDKDSEDDKKNNEAIQLQFVAFEKVIKDLKLQFQHHGGGSMNRKISVNGTVISTRYTDINFKAGTNITLTKADNNTTKQVDFTITSSGGGAGNNFSINEVPSGAINDSNLIFTTANLPVNATLAVYVNRLRLNLTSDYSISTQTITLINAVGTGGSIIIDYQY